MADPVDEILDYVDVDDDAPAKKIGSMMKGHYAGTHAAGFRDFLLSPELNHAIGDCGFEHPSQVQQECIPQALLGTDIICQGKSGMGKTAVFVISVLHQLDPVPGEISCLVIAPTRELSFQICSEFKRFTKYLPAVKTSVIFGGIPKSNHVQLLKAEKPNVLVACPGRCHELAREKVIDLSKVRYFVIDEADKVLEKEDMRHDVDQIGSIFIENDSIENHIQHENRYKLPLPPLKLTEIFKCNCQSPKNLLNNTNRQKSIKKRNDEALTIDISASRSNVQFGRMSIAVKRR
jgi:ATP-dependent RNA helicase UAP56/SUB2